MWDVNNGRAKSRQFLCSSCSRISSQISANQCCGQLIRVLFFFHCWSLSTYCIGWDVVVTCEKWNYRFYCPISSHSWSARDMFLELHGRSVPRCYTGSSVSRGLLLLNRTSVEWWSHLPPVSGTKHRYHMRRQSWRNFVSLSVRDTSELLHNCTLKFDSQANRFEKRCPKYE